MTQHMPLLGHFEELRKRLLWCMVCIGTFSIASYSLYPMISQVILAPFLPSMVDGASINVNSIYEGFFVKIKVSALGGLVLSLPFILFQICRFVLPGLKPGEKKWMIILLFASSIFSICSTYVGYAIVFPYIVTSLLQTAFVPDNIHVLLNYNENLSSMIAFLVGGIVVFQSPILLMVLLAKQWITRRYLLKNARWFIVGIVVCSAIVTPPDIFSQLCLALPLVGCYFACILLAKIMGWGQPC
ncbi:MAG: twin-arginine translocase subunit TatC [Candidatus Margulisbacteria bacterium]|nr:twin-arginine translocase subunit TatC [Candidatus Margulisiibacteriota bacterium]